MDYQMWCLMDSPPPKHFCHLVLNIILGHILKHVSSEKCSKGVGSPIDHKIGVGICRNGTKTNLDTHNQKFLPMPNSRE